MNKNLSFSIGRTAALTMVLLTLVFAISLMWEMIHLSEFAKHLGYVASLLLAVSVVIMMACFYVSTQTQLKLFGSPMVLR